MKKRAINRVLEGSVTPDKQMDIFLYDFLISFC